MKKGCKIKCCLLLLILILGIFGGMVIADRDCFPVPNSLFIIIFLLLGIFSVSLIFFICCVDSNNCEKSKDEIVINPEVINNIIQEAIATEFKNISEKLRVDLVQTYTNDYISKNDNDKKFLALFNFIRYNVKSKDITIDKLVEILRILDDVRNGDSTTKDCNEV